METDLDTPEGNLRRKIRKALAQDPGLPWGGLVLRVAYIPKGLEVQTAVGGRNRLYRMTIEEIVE